MKTQWRLIISDSDSPAWNMAADEMLLLTSSQSSFPTTLRFYSWQIPTLSLGYAQSIQDVNLQNLRSKKWGLVRRPTGGKAILHVDEVTYSVTAPLTSPVASGNLLDSYQRISRALVRALSLMGLNAANDREYNPPVGVNKSGAVCFEVPSNYEITVNGKKLIGSAQARKNQAMLQHGAIPLQGDLTRINEVLAYEDETALIIENQKLLAHATTIEQVSGKVFSWEKTVNFLRSGFAQEFDVSLVEDCYSQNELENIQTLASTKYDSPEWNYRI